MSNVTWGVLVSAIFLVLSGCGSESLSESEALTMAREAGGYPQPTYLRMSVVPGSDPLAAEINRLNSEGLAIQLNAYGQITSQPEEGVEPLVRFFWNRTYGHFSDVLFYTHEIDLLEIEEILIDKEDGIALVKAKETLRPTSSYYNDLQKINPIMVNEALEEREQRSETMTYQFRKWDDGWRIM